MDEKVHSFSPKLPLGKTRVEPGRGRSVAKRREGKGKTGSPKGKGKYRRCYFGNRGNRGAINLRSAYACTVPGTYTPQGLLTVVHPARANHHHHPALGIPRGSRRPLKQSPPDLPTCKRIPPKCTARFPVVGRCLVLGMQGWRCTVHCFSFLVSQHSINLCWSHRVSRAPLLTHGASPTGTLSHCCSSMDFFFDSSQLHPALMIGHRSCSFDSRVHDRLFKDGGIFFHPLKSQFNQICHIQYCTKYTLPVSKCIAMHRLTFLPPLRYPIISLHTYTLHHNLPRGSST